MREGGATPAMVEQVHIEYYGSETPLSQMASVIAPQPDLLVIQPWDKSALSPCDRGIIAANIGLSPSNDGSVMRIPVPPPSEERRRELVKSAKSRGEEAKIAIRNARRTAKDEIKSTQESESLSEDMRYEAEERLQALTDAHVNQVDGILTRKEGEISEEMGS